MPAYQKLLYRAWPRSSHARTVMTIHNMAYQGLFWHWDMLLTGLDWKHFNWQQMEFYGQLNLLKTGIVFADAISTVSPTYAREIQSAPGGCGLEGVLAARSDVLAGIVNGIDTAAWNPAADPHLPRRYGARRRRRGQVRRPHRRSRPGSAMRPPIRGRWSPSSAGSSSRRAIELVIEMLGADGGQRPGALRDPRHRQPTSTRRLLRRAGRDVSGHDRLVIGFDEGLAHLVQAAADIALVPSLFEPCGLTQLYALRYGSIPVVRATGGLVDTVVDATPETLRDGTASGLRVRGLRCGRPRACPRPRHSRAHADRPLWSGLVRQAMRQDWSWEASGREYLRLFERACANPPTRIA